MPMMKRLALKYWQLPERAHSEMSTVKKFSPNWTTSWTKYVGMHKIDTPKVINKKIFL